MADRERDLTKVLSNLDQEIGQGQIPAPPTRASTSVEAFAPQKYRNAGGDSIEQIQQDFRRVMAEFEQRWKALMEQLKQIAG